MIRKYLINVINLPIVVIIILAAILMRFWMGPKILSVASDVFGTISFLLIVFAVGMILQYNPPNDRGNRLVKCKEKISSWVETHKHLKWLQGDRAVEFSLLYIGGIAGLCGLGLRIYLDIIS
jgi:hypothetical protein